MKQVFPIRSAIAAGLGAWLALAATAAAPQAAAAQDVPDQWQRAFPKTDFSQHAVAYDSIMSGGVPRDGIPAIDDPSFVSASTQADTLGAEEPVIALTLGGEARAYPLRILTWHEIVNDTVAGQPVAVTYCPLCNAAIVFDARLGEQRLDFGTTGKLRHSDLVMYDRQTETWWQQFTGKGIVGEHTGKHLKVLPSRLTAWQDFLTQHPDGRVLVPNNPRIRPYGRNPYKGYDTAERPALYRGPMPEKMPAMGRVVVVDETAWDLRLLRAKERIESGDLVLKWRPGQASALDSSSIAEGRDVGSVVVQRQTADGLKDTPYDVTFAFVFKAFHPEGTWHVQGE